MDRLPNISPEVAGLDQPFRQKFQASTSIGLMAMVPVVKTSQGLVALCGI